MHRLIIAPLLCLLASCSTQPGSTPGSLPPSARGMPQIINVSAYDPKERQREGRSYSEHDLSALRANGASGLIARAGKGGSLDEKCASFVASADRAGMLPGIYYRVQRHVDAVAQADQFVNRAMALARGRSWNAPSLLLCGDFDGDLPLSAILRFMDRVEARTGVVPVAYLENSTQLKQTLSGADAATKAKLRRMPYWLALVCTRQRRRASVSRAGQSERPRGSISRVVRLDDVAIRRRGLGAWPLTTEGLQPRPLSLLALLWQSRPPDRAECLPWLARGAVGVLAAARAAFTLRQLLAHPPKRVPRSRRGLSARAR
jgi:hypothetical protein